MILLLAVLMVSAQQRNQTVQIFHVPMPPNWPIVVAPDIPVGLKLSQNATYTWSFGGSSNGCTTGGRAGVDPCVGRIADYTYDKEGEYTVTLTIQDGPSRSQIRVQKKVTVFRQQDFPIAERPEIRQVSSAWLQKWHNGLYRLKNIGVYDHFVRIHVGSFNTGRIKGPAHSGPAFLPWHRSLTYIIERAIATAIGDDTVGMPYWNWMQGVQGLETAMGPNGDQNQNGLVNSGPFCYDARQTDSSKCNQKWQLPFDYPGSVKSLQRQYTSNGFKFQNQDQFNALMNISVYDTAPFNRSSEDSFRNALEGWSYRNDIDTPFGANHNAVHLYVGGTMLNVSVSLNDPLFLIHHAQVDRLLTIWQKKYKCDDGHGSVQCFSPAIIDPRINSSNIFATETNINGQDTYVIEGHMFNSQLWPWKIAVNQVLKSQQGYKYLEPTQKPRDPVDRRTDKSAEPLITFSGQSLDPELSQSVYEQPASSGSQIYPYLWAVALIMIASM